MSAAPRRVDIKTDEHGAYEERWMVPPPDEGTMYRVTAEAWIAEYADPDDPSQIALLSVRLIHEWKCSL